MDEWIQPRGRPVSRQPKRLVDTFTGTAYSCLVSHLVKEERLQEVMRVPIASSVKQSMLLASNTLFVGNESTNYLALNTTTLRPLGITKLPTTLMCSDGKRLYALSPRDVTIEVLEVEDNGTVREDTTVPLNSPNGTSRRASGSLRSSTSRGAAPCAESSSSTSQPQHTIVGAETPVKPVQYSLPSDIIIPANFVPPRLEEGVFHSISMVNNGLRTVSHEELRLAAMSFSSGMSLLLLPPYSLSISLSLSLSLSLCSVHSRRVA